MHDKYLEDYQIYQLAVFLLSQKLTSNN